MMMMGSLLRPRPRLTLLLSSYWGHVMPGQPGYPKVEIYTMYTIYRGRSSMYACNRQRIDAKPQNMISEGLRLRFWPFYS